MNQMHFIWTQNLSFAILTHQIRIWAKETNESNQRICGLEAIVISNRQQQMYDKSNRSIEQNKIKTAAKTTHISFTI